MCTLYDDQFVAKRSIDFLRSELVKRNAYILFYEKDLDIKGDVQDRDEKKEGQAKKSRTSKYYTKNMTTDPGDIQYLGKIGHIMIGNEDLQRLEDQIWLNDKIINAYLTILERKNERIIAIDSFFMEKLRSGARITLPAGLKEKDVVLIPVHTPCHWTLIAVYPKQHQLSHLDSARMQDNQAYIPCQTNSNDCGVYVLLLAENICNNEPMDIRAENVLSERLRIQAEIMNSLEEI